MRSSTQLHLIQCTMLVAININLLSKQLLTHHWGWEVDSFVCKKRVVLHTSDWLEIFTLYIFSNSINKFCTDVMM